MNTRTFLHSQVAIQAVALILCLSSCAVKREVPFRPHADFPVTSKVARVDYSTCTRVPDRPTSLTYRTVLKTIPYTRQRAFWGNWGGCGSKGGYPVDEMDEIFRRHDIIYYETRSLATMRAADKACVAALQKLDTSRMSPEARAYHQRAIRFFSNPTYAPVGKPLSCFVYRKESPDSPFRTERDLYRFFQIEDMAELEFEDRSFVKKTRETDNKNQTKPETPRELVANAG